MLKLYSNNRFHLNDLERKVMTKVSSNSNIAVAVAAGAVGVIAGRFVWKRIKNRKAKK